jgi:hypothetical protein
VRLTLPCYRYGPHLVWGLTLGIIDELVRPFAQWR